MSKVTAESWLIAYNEPYDEDEEPYYVTYEYKGKDGSHSVSSHHKTYQSAYGWLAERIVL